MFGFTYDANQSHLELGIDEVDTPFVDNYKHFEWQVWVCILLWKQMMMKKQRQNRCGFFSNILEHYNNDNACMQTTIIIKEYENE
jgi:hypothetical protein